MIRRVNPKRMLDITELMSLLSEERAIFHSEADFQHALAWQIHQHHPSALIRLERQPPSIDARMYIDVWIELDGMTHALELKYPTKKLSVTQDDELFNLAEGGAQDETRYDFLKDIQRLEQVVKMTENTVGHAVLLTNDGNFLKAPRNNDVNDIQFRIHEGVVITGEMDWGPKKSDSAKRKRSRPIQLNGKYHAQWRDFSTLDDSTGGDFRYLNVEIGLSDT